MRTKFDREIIVTDNFYNGNEYIMAAIQNCNWENEVEEKKEGEGGEEEK